jgi:ABC-2 type transport system permease protein
MNIFFIIMKEFKQNIRNWKANSMMVLFPIILIIILGAAFSGVFDRSVNLEGVSVIYTIGSSRPLAEAFRGFTREMSGELGINFIETTDKDEAIKSIQDTRYSCYVMLAGNPDEIMVYKNARFDFQANMVEALLKNFSQRYDAISQIARFNPGILDNILSDTGMDFTEIRSLDGKREPGSLDYYAVTMLTLILLYASLTGFWGVKTEQGMKTGSRILCAPVRKHEMLAGKVMGGILVTFVQACVVILFGKYILRADWGQDLATIFILIFAQSVMAISLGTGIAFLIRNEGAASGVLNMIIPIIAFFGGNYVPLEVMGKDIGRFSVISPVKWVNDAIFRIIYDADYSLAPMAVFINLAISAAFIAVAVLLSRVVSKDL